MSKLCPLPFCEISLLKLTDILLIVNDLAWVPLFLFNIFFNDWSTSWCSFLLGSIEVALPLWQFRFTSFVYSQYFLILERVTALELQSWLLWGKLSLQATHPGHLPSVLNVPEEKQLVLVIAFFSRRDFLLYPIWSLPQLFRVLPYFIFAVPVRVMVLAQVYRRYP